LFFRARKATPLEEIELQHNTRPTHLDELYTKMMDESNEKIFIINENVDGEDHLTKQLMEQKKARRASMLKEKTAAKEKAAAEKKSQ
jgi:hypothetical protein